MVSLSNLKDPEFLSFLLCFSSIEILCEPISYSWYQSFLFQFVCPYTAIWGHRVVNSKESIFQSRRCEFDPWVRKIPWRRKWPPIPVFLPGKSHGQRSLVGYSPGDHKRVRHNLMIKQQAVQQFHQEQQTSNLSPLPFLGLVLCSFLFRLL